MTKNEFLIRFQNYSNAELLEVIEHDHFVSEAIEAANELFQAKNLSPEANDEARLQLEQLLQSREENEHKATKLIKKMSADSKKIVLKDILQGNTYMPSVFVGLAGLIYWLYFGYTNGTYLFNNFFDQKSIYSLMHLLTLFILPIASLYMLYRNSIGWVLATFFITMKVSFMLFILPSMIGYSFIMNPLGFIETVQPIIPLTAIFILLIHSDFREDFSISFLHVSIGIGGGCLFGFLCNYSI